MIRLPNRFLLFMACVAYLVSTYLVLYASASDVPVPRWVGYLDVGVVLLILFLSFTIFWKGKDNPRFLPAYLAALNIVPLIFLGMWVYRDSLDFNILLPGLAWRTFLFLHTLPYALNVWKPEKSNA